LGAGRDADVPLLLCWLGTAPKTLLLTTLLSTANDSRLDLVVLSFPLLPARGEMVFVQVRVAEQLLLLLHTHNRWPRQAGSCSPDGATSSSSGSLVRRAALLLLHPILLALRPAALLLQPASHRPAGAQPHC
jgi:hypothetical protein